MPNKSTKTRPAHEIRVARVKATIWANETEHGTRHNVTVSRLYKNDDDQWQDSNSFGRDDLPLVIKAVDRAHDWILNGGRPHSEAEDEHEEESF